MKSKSGALLFCAPNEALDLLDRGAVTGEVLLPNGQVGVVAWQ
ncbi:hypothetical protein [Streptomyces olivaceus]